MTVGQETRRPDSERLFALVSDFYWEQDAEGRFTRLEGEMVGRDAVISSEWRDRTPGEIGFEVDTDYAWPARSDPAARADAFRDRIVAYDPADSTRRYFSISGEAVYGPRGDFRGYLGFGKDVTRHTLEQLELSQFRAAIDGSLDMIYITDRDTMRFVYVNEMACELTGLDREALLRIPPHEMLLLSREQLERDYDEVIREGGLTRESRSRTGDGRRTTVEVHRRALQQGGRWLIVSIVHDIGKRKRDERRRKRLERMYAALSATNEAILRAATPDELHQRVCDAAVGGGGLALAAVLLADPQSLTLSVKACAGRSADAVRELAISVDPEKPKGTGLVGDCFRSREPRVTQDYLNDERTRHWHASARQNGTGSAAVVPIVKQDRTLGVMLLTARAKHAFNEDSIRFLERMAENLVFALENFEHEAERKRGEAHIQYLATHDSLTDLPNRSLFNQLLTMAIESSHRHDRQFALMFIDLDRFKIINDSLGHAAGDTLLQTVARRLRDCLRSSDVVARIGGDEFLVLVQEIDGATAAGQVARQLLGAVMEPVKIQEREYRVTTSVGIALYPDDADDASVLMKNADMAMYQAKEQGKNNFQFYCTDMQTRTLERMRLETCLRQAPERQEFSLAYQGRISLNTGEISGVEALLRWHSDELGDLTPNQFLPIAEETGLIVPIGRWVLETACAQNLAWQKAGLQPLCIAVNISPVQFADSHLLSCLAEVLEQTGMPPELLELEITESAVMRDVDRAMHLLKEIKRLGVRVVIDNFGTGYSSLTQLRQLPVDSLKIDRSFIRDLCHEAADQSTARAIIAMAKNLSVNVVAEGVETAEQQNYLRTEACDDVQGFYFSHPNDQQAFADMLRSHVPCANSA